MLRLSWPRTVERLTRRALWQHAKSISTESDTKESRPAEPSKPVPLYSIPRLILDLDAEDCSQVRPYNKQDTQEQLKQWSRNPETEALVKRVLDFKEEVLDSRRLFKDSLRPYDVRHITPRDVLSLAFLGSPETGRHSPDDSLRSGNPTSESPTLTQEPKLGILSQDIFQLFGVSERLLVDPHQTLSILMTRLRQADSPPSNTETSEGDPRAFETSLSAAGTDFHRISRLVHPLLGTDHGCRLLAESGPAILTACAQADLSTNESLMLEIRCFLANVALNLASRDIVSTALFSPFGPFVQKLLGPQLTVDAQRILLLQDILLRSPSRETTGFKRISGIFDGFRELVFNPGCFSGLRGASLHATIRGDPHFRGAYVAYILSLGEAGSLRGLWHEWQWSKSWREPWRLQVFVAALMKTFSILQQYSEQNLSKVYSTCTGSLDEDILLDFRSISDLEAVSPVQDTPQIHGERPVELATKIEAALNIEDISRSLRKLQELSGQLAVDA
jgi:hypothetical protein